MPISIIVPVYNGATTLGECLAALAAATAPGDEILVVDDGSTDAGAALADAAGVPVLRLAGNSGPAAARNAGARVAHGDVLLFVDADVVIHPDVVTRVRRTLAEHPELAAVFGSYDDHPRAPGIVAQYRNLLHHYVHQHGAPDASSFWAGCGAVRRDAFVAVGGFDERPWRRAIEDIELGYRLRAAGHRILLDHGLLSTHLKRWTLRSMLWTDLAARAVPWSRLLLETPRTSRELNLTPAQRWSVALVGSGLAALGFAVCWPAAFWVGILALAAVVFLNRDLYVYLGRVRGPVLALAGIPLHLLYFVCCGLGFVYAWVGHAAGRRP